MCSFFVPGGAGGHRAGVVGGIPAHSGADLGRAGGVDIAGLFGNAGYSETAQAPRGAGVGLDAVPKLDRFGRRRQAADSGGGVQVVAQHRGVKCFPTAPGVPHGHDVGNQHVFS